MIIFQLLKQLNRSAYVKDFYAIY